MRRALVCMGLQAADHLSPPGADLAARQQALKPWQDRFTIAEGHRVWVQASGPNGRECVDAREWIETLHDRKRWPAGTVWELVVEHDGSSDA